MQKVMLIGYLGRAPEVKYSQQGTAIAQFSVATTERWTGRHSAPRVPGFHDSLERTPSPDDVVSLGRPLQQWTAALQPGTGHSGEILEQPFDRTEKPPAQIATRL